MGQVLAFTSLALKLVNLTVGNVLTMGATGIQED
jgi:hypothetical protein